MKFTSRKNNRGSVLMVSNIIATIFILSALVIFQYLNAERAAHRGRISGSAFTNVIFAATNIVGDNKSLYTASLVSGPFPLNLNDIKSEHYLPTGYVSPAPIQIIVAQSIYGADPVAYIIKKHIPDHTYQDQKFFLEGFKESGGKELYIKNGLAGSENTQILNIIETALGTPLDTGDMYTSSEMAVENNIRAVHRNSIPGKEYLNSMDTDLAIDADLNNTAAIETKALDARSDSSTAKLSVFEKFQVNGDSEFEAFNVTNSIEANNIKSHSLNSSSLSSSGLINATGQTVTATSAKSQSLKTSDATTNSFASSNTNITTLTTTNTLISPDISASIETEVNNQTISNETIAVDATVTGLTTVTGDCSGC